MDSITYPEDNQSHIPKNAFAYTIIEFLLDQNTTLASIAQQSVVTLAAELADTPRESEKYTLHQALLNVEIFQGVVLGLISIFSGNQQQQQQQKDDDESDDEQRQDTNTTTTTTTTITSSSSSSSSDTNDKDNMDITVLDAPVNNTTTAVVEKKPPTTNTSEINNIVSAATSILIKNYDNGGVNLAKMVCLMVRVCINMSL